MPLTLYRRHALDCKFLGRPRRDPRSQKCSCLIWVQGSLGLDYLRESLNLTCWDAAQRLVRVWEVNGTRDVDASATPPNGSTALQAAVLQPTPPPPVVASPPGEPTFDVPSIVEAIDRFFDDAKARELSPDTIDKYTLLLRKRLLPWCLRHGLEYVPDLTVDWLTQFRGTWDLAGITKYKTQERLAAFCHFCVLRDWLRTNPAMRMGQVRLKPVPTLPFEEDEMQRIIEACDRYSRRGTYGAQNRDRMRTLTWLMRYSGLRIRDSVTCRRDRLKGNRLFLYQAKTGVPVYCPMPPFLVEALHALPGRHPDYFFWTGNGKPKSAVADAQRSYRKLFKLAKVKGHPHMFRDTFAVELLKRGVSLETVSTLLGHASTKVTEKHYRPWVKALQDRLEAEAAKGWNSPDQHTAQPSISIGANLHAG